MGRAKQSADPGQQPAPDIPYRTGAEQENRCISLAMEEAEKRLRNGTATSQLISQFVRYGTEREKYEREKLRRENELLEVKAEAIRSAERMEEIYAKAIDAMRTYGGE